VTWQELREIAKLAMTDWRTVRRFLGGAPMRPSTKARVVKALKKHSQRKERKL
jgi:DNA-binding LacI/PurR family transcriptional regulator